MTPFYELGKALLIFGAAAAVIGLILMAAPKIPWLGRLPGDILLKREGIRFFFPLGTCLLVSVVLTVLLWLFRR